MSFLVSYVFGGRLDRVKVILERVCRHLSLMWRTCITSCRNAIRIMLFLLVFGYFCRWEKGRISYGLVKNIQLYCFALTNFQHKKLYSFQTLSLGFILKIYLKFRRFQPRYSYKTCFYKKERVYKSFLWKLKRSRL